MSHAASLVASIVASVNGRTMPKKKKEKTVQSPLPYPPRAPVRVTTTAHQDTAAQPLAALECLEDEEIRHKKTKSKPDNVHRNGPDSCSGVETEEGECICESWIHTHKKILIYHHW